MAGETWHTCLKPESHGTQQRCWRWSRFPQRVRDAMRCRDKPESWTARSVPKRHSGASRSNGGRRRSLDQALAVPGGGLVQKSIGAVSLVRRQKTGPIPQPVSRFVCLTWGNIEKVVVVWSLVIGSRNCLEKLRWEADSMRRGVSRPVIRLCCFLCPVCPPSAQPVIWGHPVTTADWAGVRGGRAGHRALRLGRRHPGFVSTSGAPKTPRVFWARCGPAPRPAPSSSAHEGSPPPRPARTRGPGGTVEHWCSLRGRAALPPSGPTTACATPITCLPPACLSRRRRRLLPLLPLPHSC